MAAVLEFHLEWDSASRACDEKSTIEYGSCGNGNAIVRCSVVQLRMPRIKWTRSDGRLFDSSWHCRLSRNRATFRYNFV
jgi:hypothetical protein